jgi:flagellar biosynthesis protein FlhF
MKVRKFTARTSKDALRQVREDLGPDAAILANRMTKGGVEVIAVAASELPPQAFAKPSIKPLEVTERDVVGQAQFKPAFAETVRQRQVNDPRALDERDELLQSIRDEVVALREHVGSPNSEAAPANTWLGPLISEIQVLKDMMGSLAMGEAERQPPGKAEVLDQLCRAGFSPAFAMKILARLPREVTGEAAKRFAESALALKVPVSASAQPMIDEGGIYALVGPTGAGKTTTLAKLAARFVVRHGAEHLALISTDGYRIGGQEQLKIYGKLLGVPVYPVRDSEDLARTLSTLSSRKLVLIDTVGRSQRDMELIQQKKLFSEASNRIQSVLLLNSTCHGDTLEDVVEAYGDVGLAGVILSKLDEARTAGAAIEVAIRKELKILYTTVGQRVPEDMRGIDPKALIRDVLATPPKRSAFTAWWAESSRARGFEGQVHG